MTYDMNPKERMRSLVRQAIWSVEIEVRWWVARNMRAPWGLDSKVLSNLLPKTLRSRPKSHSPRKWDIYSGLRYRRKNQLKAGRTIIEIMFLRMRHDIAFQMACRMSDQDIIRDYRMTVQSDALGAIAAGKTTSWWPSIHYAMWYSLAAGDE